MLHVSLLGEQVISDGSGVIRTRSSRTVALAAFLIVHAGVPQPRQRIASTFWPDSTDEQALTNLRRELHHLRNALGRESALVVTPRDLCWRDNAMCRVDVRVFVEELRAARDGESDSEILEHATIAVAEYRGEFLPGGYDDWLLDARAELEQQCVELLDLICTARTRTGDLHGGVDAARRRIQLRPLEETGYRTLMELQGDLGDRAGAVSTYHRCASVLERELGVEPDPATRAVFNRLLARSGPEDAAVPEPTSGRSGLAAVDLVGRSAELAELRKAWDHAASGHPNVITVRGDPGVGKTRLVAELAASARRAGAVVAIARCFGSSGRLALSPVADWLRDPAVARGAAALEPVWRAEVERLVPSSKTRVDLADGSRAMVDAWQRHRFFEGLARALFAVDRPLLLVLDNLHWCDQETLAFMAFLVGLADDRPVMIATTERTDEHDYEPGLAQWSARLRSTGLLTEIALLPLDVTATARLAEAITAMPVADEDAELLQATTGGFPLYIVEAARSTVEPGSSELPVGDLMGVLRHRLDQVGPATREVVGIAAAVGRNFTLDLLSEASDLDADTVVQAVNELWSRRIVREMADGYDFSHDLLRDAAYDQVSPPQRWLLHRRIAQALELVHADDLDSVSAQLAEQYARSGRAARAIGYYRRAADIATGTFAHTEAVRLHREALAIVRALPEGRDRWRQELEILVAIAAPLNARLGYSSPELRTILDQTITLAELVGRPDIVRTSLVGLWMSLYVQGDMVAAQRIAEQAFALAAPGSAMSAHGHFALGGAALTAGHPAQALEHFDLTAELGSPESLSVGPRPAIHARAWAAHVLWLLGDDDAVLAYANEAVTEARGTDSPYNLAVALAYAGITQQLRHNRAGVSDVVGELCLLCERYGFAYYGEWALVLTGWCRTGEAGVALAQRGITNLTDAGSFARMPYWLSLLADLYTDHDAEAARATLDAALIGAHARHDVWWLPEVMRMRAAYDAAPAERLQAAARLAASHGSVALVRRCAADLSALGVRAVG